MEKIKSILISRIFYSQTRGRHCAPLRTTIPTEPNCSKKMCFCTWSEVPIKYLHHFMRGGQGEMPQFGFFNLASFQHGNFCQKKTLIKLKTC